MELPNVTFHNKLREHTLIYLYLSRSKYLEVVGTLGIHVVLPHHVHVVMLHIVTVVHVP